jgi:hypothetical protein
MKQQNRSAALFLFLLLLLPSPILFAGLKYEQTTQLSGTMIETLKKMPLVGKKLSGDMAQALFFSADSMRSDTFLNGKLTRSEIIRLDKETMIQIDHERRTYSEMTFAEWKARMEKTMKELKSEREGSAEVTMTPKITVQDTGETMVIQGYDTRHYILTLSMEIQDSKNSQKGTMEMITDLWNTKNIPGFEEQRQFYTRYAEKIGTMAFYRDAAAAMSGMMQDANMARGMAEMKKEMEKMEGMPVRTVASIRMPGAPGSSAPQEPSQDSAAAQTPAAETPNITAAAKGAATESATSAMNRSISKAMGGFGGFGGFGKKKKKPEPAPEEAAEQAPEAPAQTAAAPSGTSVPLEPFMKTTTELKNVEKTSLSPELFQIPAGYKPVQAD